MTADPRPALRAVPADGDARGGTLAAWWEPQHQFVGALLWHTAATASTMLDLVPPAALTDPLTRWTYELIAALVADGRDPHPPAVLHRAKTRPAAGALHPDRAPSTRDHRRLASHLADLYTRVLDPRAAADHARDVLDGAYRSAFAAGGRRMQRVAESSTAGVDLTHCLAAIRDELDELRRRTEAAAQAVAAPARPRTG